MARIRSIKPEFCSSADTGALSRDARLFFLQLLTEADDAGRLLWIPRRLCGVLYPFDDDVTEAELERWAAEAGSRGMLTLYAAGGTRYLQITNWNRHQRINRATPSKLPAPPESSVSAHAEPSEQRVRTHGALSEDVHREREGNREGEREQGENLSSADKPPTPSPEPPPPTDLTARLAERIGQITDDATTAYNAICARPHGLMPVATAAGRDTRVKQIRRALHQAKAICREQYGTEHIPPEFWRALCTEAQRDEFLSGRQGGGRDHPNWVPDFEYLTRPATMLKIFERAVSDDGEAQA